MALNDQDHGSKTGVTLVRILNVFEKPGYNTRSNTLDNFKIYIIKKIFIISVIKGLCNPVQSDFRNEYHHRTVRDLLPIVSREGFRDVSSPPPRTCSRLLKLYYSSKDFIFSRSPLYLRSPTSGNRVGSTKPYQRMSFTPGS